MNKSVKFLRSSIIYLTPEININEIYNGLFNLLMGGIVEGKIWSSRQRLKYVMQIMSVVNLYLAVLR